MTAKPISLSVICTLVAAGVLSTASQTLAQSCGSWQIVPNPQLDGEDIIPTMIVAFSPDSAVGLRDPLNQLGVVYMVWDGSAWMVDSVDSIPELEFGTGWNMRAVTGSAPDDLWATGLVGLDNFHGVPFLAHFDGTEWTAEVGTIFEDPNPQAGDPLRTAEGSDLVVFAPDDIWVFGAGEDLEQTVSNPIACHWDGSNLEEVDPPQPVYNHWNLFESGDGASSDDLWMVGYGRNNGANFHLFTQHWDGQQWSAVTEWTQLPDQNIVQDFLRDVAAIAEDDVWAVGEKLLLDGSTTHSASFYLHWNGTSWTEFEGPDVGPLTSVTASGPDNVWASNAYGEFGGRLAHFDGTSWTEVNSAPIEDATHIGLSRVFASSAGDVWAIGYWAVYNGAGGWDVYEDLIEHYTSGCAGDADGDGAVGIADLLAVIGAWGPCVGCPEDFDDNGAVDVMDLLMVLSSWNS